MRTKKKLIQNKKNLNYYEKNKITVKKILMN